MLLYYNCCQGKKYCFAIQMKVSQKVNNAKQYLAVKKKISKMILLFTVVNSFIYLVKDSYLFSIICIIRRLYFPLVLPHSCSAAGAFAGTRRAATRTRRTTRSGSRRRFTSCSDGRPPRPSERAGGGSGGGVGWPWRQCGRHGVQHAVFMCFSLWEGRTGSESAARGSGSRLTGGRGGGATVRTATLSPSHVLNVALPF